MSVNSGLFKFSVAAVAVMMVASSCGGSDSTDDDAGTESTVGSGTSPAAGNGPTSGLLDPLPEGNKQEELFDLVIDLHGPTADLSKEMNRLIYFPDIPTPKNAHILQLKAAPSPASGSDTAFLANTIKFATDSSVTEIEELFATKLTEDGWRLGENPAAGLAIASGNAETIDYVKGGDSLAKEESLSIEIEKDGDINKQTVEVEYQFFSFADLSIIDRFDGWHGDAPIPAGGEHKSSAVSTFFRSGKTQVTYTSSHKYLEGDTSETALLDLAKAGADAKSIDYESSNDVTYTYPNLTVDEDWKMRISALQNSANEGFVNTRGETYFTSPPFGEAGNDASATDSGTESTEPLPQLATAKQIQDTLSDIKGPTTDVSAQMQRLAEFPQIPTPANAEIVSLLHTLGGLEGQRGAPRGKQTTSLIVQFKAEGSGEEIETLFRTSLSGEGYEDWELDGRESTKGNAADGIEIKFGYTTGTSDHASPVRITINDDPFEKSSRSKVTVAYNTTLKPGDELHKKHLGWFGNAPFPKDGRQDSTEIGLDSKGVTYSTFWRNQQDDAAINETAVAAQMASSDYTMGAEITPNKNEVSHPDLAEATIYITLTGVQIEARNPLS